MGKKQKPGFNTPFHGLPSLPPPPKPAAPAPPPPPPRPSRRDEDEGRIFEEAMRGVTPLAGAGRARRANRATAGGGPPAAQRLAARATEDALAEAELADLIDSAGALRVEQVGESVAATAPGMDRRMIKRLRAGQFAVEGELDLHGRTREQAADDLTRFFARARDDGKRCLLVIHGRGLGSGPEGAVLPALVRHTLAEGPLRRLVLAFTSAPPSLGGDGALLVLLRRRRRGR